ncbi:hypothetical protein LINPERPRIM_LOCUS3716 [Linum perenne]
MLTNPRIFRLCRLQNERSGD